MDAGSGTAGQEGMVEVCCRLGAEVGRVQRRRKHVQTSLLLAAHTIMNVRVATNSPPHPRARLSWRQVVTAPTLPTTRAWMGRWTHLSPLKLPIHKSTQAHSQVHHGTGPQPLSPVTPPL